MVIIYLTTFKQMNIHKLIRLISVLLLTLQILFPFPLFADTIGKLSEIRGDVSVRRGNTVIKPKTEDEVQTQDVVTTGDKSRAKLLLKDDSLLSVGQNSTLEVTEFLLDQNKRSGILSLRSGTMHTKVEKFLEPNSKFEVRTPTAVAGARGTEWLTVISPNPGTTISVLAGSVQVSSTTVAGPSIIVTAGFSTTVAAGSLPTVPALIAPGALTAPMGQVGAQIPAGTATGAGGAGAGAGGAGAGAGAAGSGAAAGTGAAAGIGPVELRQLQQVWQRG